ncbi:MAG: TIGR00725 family protein [Candidatus Omnitrophota bacterium]
MAEKGVIQQITVSVIGGHDCSDQGDQFARQVGKIIAERECVLVCGGLLGTMQAACRGAKEAGGTTIGILPGKTKIDANPFVDIALPTTIGFARNVIVAASADVVVALPGSHGTQSEICYALVYKRPVIDLGGWNIEGMIRASGLEDLPGRLDECIQKVRDADGRPVVI